MIKNKSNSIPIRVIGLGVLLFSNMNVGNAMEKWLDTNISLKKEFAVQGMVVSLVRSNKYLTATVTVKTKGWFLIGFNETEGIVGADLKMVRLVNGVWETSDRKTVGFGSYPEDETLGGDNQMIIKKATRSVGCAKVTLQIPLVTSDMQDFNHTLSSSYYIILAWSLSSDWLHHSRVREHFKLNWE